MDVQKFYGQEKERADDSNGDDTQDLPAKTRSRKDTSGAHGPDPQQASTSGVKGRFPSRKLDMSDIRKIRKESARFVFIIETKMCRKSDMKFLSSQTKYVSDNKGICIHPIPETFS